MQKSSSWAWEEILQFSINLVLLTKGKDELDTSLLKEYESIFPAALYQMAW